MPIAQWRPTAQIKVKALGLHWREGKLLAAEVYDDQGALKGVRPLGGSIEFGERWQFALQREFKEELNVEVQIQGAPIVMENLYTHEGAAGHEVLFICEVLFDSEPFNGQNSIEFHENDGALCIARWFDLNDLDRPGGPALFPDGLKAVLMAEPHSSKG